MPHPAERSPPKLLGTCAWVIFGGILGTASANPPLPDTRTSHERPSKLDYLVLASLADSPHLMAMVGYRAAATQQVARAPVRKITPSKSDDK